MSHKLIERNTHKLWMFMFVDDYGQSNLCLTVINSPATQSCSSPSPDAVKPISGKADVHDVSKIISIFSRVTNKKHWPGGCSFILVSVESSGRFQQAVNRGLNSANEITTSVETFHYIIIHAELSNLSSKVLLFIYKRTLIL